MKRWQLSGFTLLEIVISIALSSIIIAGIITLYLAIKNDNNRQQAIIDLEDSARFAQLVLNQRIRTAGYVGCSNPDNPVDQQQAITGYDSEHLPSELQNQVIAGTDAVVIHSCVSRSDISNNAALVSMAYFIGDTHRTNHQGQHILALFQKPMDSDRVELAEGIEQMKILYGVPQTSNSELTSYLSAAQVTNWLTVRSVQIDYLLNSVEPMLTKPQEYYFNGQTQIATDLLIHQPWQIYVTLRERINS